ncbi:hypothetical protein E4T56_gene6025 [Termitomyces sp. T112]|nr:hypothetical protein E4T56_gene6025 [Termitomyces sp. T112]
MSDQEPLSSLLSSQLYEFVLTQGILFGLGVGLLFYPSPSSTATYFKKYRATALGIVAAGSSIGGVVYSIMQYVASWRRCV